MIMVNYTDADRARIGRELANEFKLRRSKTNRDRWQFSTWGDKTDLGVFNTVLAIAQQIETGDLHNFPEQADIQRRLNQNEERP